MRIGAHVSTSGGLDKGIDRAGEIGAEAVQFFASSPRMWRFRAPKEAEVLAFREKSESTGISPAFIHASYLVNVGGNPDLLGKSIESLVNSLEVASQLGAVGVIFHGGSHKGAGFDAVFDQAIAALKLVLERTPDDARLLIENSAGMGSHIGSSFAEIGRMVNALDNDRVGICLDTQHSIAAGYNIIEESGIEAALDEFDREIGLGRLVVVHANDSKTPLGSGVDRHENIGEGSLGEAGFETIMGHSAFRDIPFLLEVPGFGEERKGPDKENVDRLKAVRHRVGLTE
jgi:deoxyribonuclease-4